MAADASPSTSVHSGGKGAHLRVVYLATAVTAAVFAVGAVGAALAPGTAWLIAARMVAGAAIGIASFVAPLYISEIAPVEIRGKLVSINQVALTSGIVISYLVDYAFAGSQAWR